MDSAGRSKCMASIRASNTRPELIVRRLLFGLGYRYRLHAKGLPGKPDIVFPGRQKVIFVHGCYWHRHACKKGCSLPVTNRKFWQSKFAANEHRDENVQARLMKQGWKVLIVWECEIGVEAALMPKLIGFLG
ncbi:MAG: very short patch repair endonuclease [Sterolibacterium sp.]